MADANGHDELWPDTLRPATRRDAPRPGESRPGESRPDESRPYESRPDALRPAADRVFTVLRRAGQGFRELFGERRCPVCGAVFSPGRDYPEHMICPACLELLPRRQKGHCPLCGEPAAWETLPKAPCMRCLEQAPPWSGFVFHGLHQGLLRQLLLRLKFGDQVCLGRVLGTLLAEHPGLAALSVDLIAPVPLHAARLRERGFNQAQALAEPLARRLGLPPATGLLERVRATEAQTGADRAMRQRNLRRAFAASETARGKHILLVDDTMTTGATLAEAARALLDAGAASVSAAVVSRTARHSRRARP